MYSSLVAFGLAALASSAAALPKASQKAAPPPYTITFESFSDSGDDKWLSADGKTHWKSVQTADKIQAPASCAGKGTSYTWTLAAYDEDSDVPASAAAPIELSVHYWTDDQHLKQMVVTVANSSVAPAVADGLVIYPRVESKSDQRALPWYCFAKTGGLGYQAVDLDVSWVKDYEEPFPYGKIYPCPT